MPGVRELSIHCSRHVVQTNTLKGAGHAVDDVPTIAQCSKRGLKVSADVE